MGASLSTKFTRNSQSIANNSTNVTIEVWISWTYGTWNGYTMPGSLTIDGTAYSFSATFNTSASTSGSQRLFSKTVDVVHNADGNKTLNYSASFEYHTGKTITASGSQNLPLIARASQPSCITWPNHTQQVGSFGDTISIHTNRASSALTHTLRYHFGSASGTIATGVTTGTTWKIPLDLMNLIPTTTSGSGTILCDTYSGSTLVGTRTCGFTATVPASVKPTCSFTLEDVTGADGIYGSPVQALSRIKVSATATTAYSSPIASYTIEANGATYSGAEATTGVLQASGSSVVKVTVKDRRGRIGTASYTMSVQAYTPPVVSGLTLRRCNANGTENEEGAYIQVTFSAAISSMSNKNTAAYALRYKTATAASFTTYNFTALANKYTVSNQTHIFAADPDSAYDIEITATDKHGTATRAANGSTAFTLMDWHHTGTGIAFGKVSQKENTMEVALAAEFNDTVTIRGNRHCMTSPGVSGTSGFVLMARIAIVAANADTPITFLFSRRQELTDMKVSVQFKNSNLDSSTLTSIRYEGSNYGAFLVPTGALTWDLYVEKGSNYDTIALQDWYTSSTMATRIDVTFPGTLISTLPTPYHRATPAILESIMDAFMPVGYVLILYSHADPNTMYPGTTWTRIQNSFLWGVDASGTIGQTGGEKEVILDIAQMPRHSHGPTYSAAVPGTKTHAWLASGGSNMAYGEVYSGGGDAHNNMPPYTQVSIWRRTA